MIRSRIRGALLSYGYAVRDVGRGVSGIEVLHDVRVLLHGKDEPLVFDVGANVGHTTHAVLNTFRRPKIYCFEPSPQTLKMLRHNLRHQSTVVIEPTALGSIAATMPFHVTRDHSVNDSLLTPEWDAGATVVDVEVDTVDAYCQRHHIEGIDFMKIDTQGYDLQVLSGARRMLEARRIGMYCCEAHCERMYHGQATLTGLLAFAADVGYRLIGFYEQTYRNNRLIYMDALFCAPDA